MFWFIFLVIIKFSLTLAAVAITERQMHFYILHGQAFKSWSSRWHAYEHHGLGQNKWHHINLSPVDYFVTFPLLGFAIYRYFVLGRLEALAGIIGITLACCVHMVLWNKMHRAIHNLEPNNWTTRLPWFESVKRNHLEHHNDPATGLSVVFPFLDSWFGTTNSHTPKQETKV